MLSGALTLSLVIPAFSGTSRLSDRAERLIEAARDGIIDPEATELILVGDGSTDETARTVRTLLAPIFPRLHILELQKHSCKGSSIRAATNVAAAPVVAFLDIDMSVDPSQIPHLLDAIEIADVVIGSRASTSPIVGSADLGRMTMGSPLNFLTNAIKRVGFEDAECGLRAFRTPMARLLFHLTVNRSAFDVEVLWLARQLGMQISEVPVHWSDSPHKTIRPMAESISVQADVCRMQWRNRPQIPALSVEARSSNKPVRERILTEASTTFRVTDPVLSLPQDRSLIFLPLCSPTQVHGAASRLSALSDKLTVHKRLVSFRQLMKMSPLAWADTTSSRRLLRSPDSDLSEQRHLSARDVQRHTQIDLEASSRREA